MGASPQATKRWFLLPIVFLLCSSPWQLISAQKRIDNLPGFDGPLPFSLETGYVEVDEEKGVELFYYFIESERNPEGDPLLLWLTGGPGCTSFSGLAFEIGPLGFDLQDYVDGLPSLYYKPYSWTKVSNVIFLDSPIGSGFSYSRTAEGVLTSDTLAVRQLVRFLHKWFEAHPKYKSNPFYVGGSSYSGMIIPVLVLEIANATESQEAPINLKGYLAGNPKTEVRIEDNSKIPFYHRMALISDELYESTKKSCLENYANPSNEFCANNLDAVNKVIKDVERGNILDPSCPRYSPKPDQVPIRRLRQRLYDEEILLGRSDFPLECRSSSYHLSEIWANNDTVRDALGVRKGTIDDWHRCNDETIPYTKEFKSAIPYHLAATSKGYPALIYSGDHDAMVPYIGTEHWIKSLNFSIVDDWRPWYVSSQVAGFTRRYSNNLTFATVKGAGHTAPEFKPKECLAMFARWISGAPV